LSQASRLCTVASARIFHKDRRERSENASENAMNARKSAKRFADILKYVEDNLFAL